MLCGLHLVLAMSVSCFLCVYLCVCVCECVIQEGHELMMGTSRLATLTLSAGSNRFGGGRVYIFETVKASGRNFKTHRRRMECEMGLTSVNILTGDSRGRMRFTP